MSQGGAPLRQHVISLVPWAVPEPTWALHDEPLPTVIEQFDALMQGEERFSRDTPKLSMPTKRTVESEAQTYELATRIASGSFIPALQAWTGMSTAALMTLGLYGVPQRRTTWVE